MKFSKEDTLMVKGVAILMLLFYHLFYYEPMFLDFHVSFAPFSLQGVMKISRIFNICVSIFLFLTVFGMYRGYEKVEEQMGYGLSWRQLLWISLRRYFSLMLGYLAVFVSIVLFFFWDLDFTAAYGTGFRGIYYFLMDFAGVSKFFGFSSINASWWYLQLAIIIIFTMPFIYMLFQRIGYLLVPVVLLLPYILSVEYMTARYRYVVLLGLLCAKDDFLWKWKTWKITSNQKMTAVIKLCILVLLIGISAGVRQYEGDLVTEEVGFLAEGILATTIVIFVYFVFGNMQHVRKVLELFGKHSMNMYFAHLFFCYYFTHIRAVIFSGRYFLFIYVIQMMMVLLFSILLEWLKRLCKYRLLTDTIRKWCEQKVLTNSR